MTSTVVIAGQLENDPQISYTRAGHAKVTLCLRTLVRGQHASEEPMTPVVVEAVGDLAEHCAMTLTKGHRVLVAGELRINSISESTYVEAFDVGPSLTQCTAEVHPLFEPVTS